MFILHEAYKVGWDLCYSPEQQQQQLHQQQLPLKSAASYIGEDPSCSHKYGCNVCNSCCLTHWNK